MRVDGSGRCADDVSTDEGRSDEPSKLEVASWRKTYVLHYRGIR